MKYLKLGLAIGFLCLLVYVVEDTPDAGVGSKTSISANTFTLPSTWTAIEDYQQARAVLWQSLYPNGGKTLYCGQSFNSNQRSGFNVEHVFPMSWVTNSLNCGTRDQCRTASKTFNQIEADLHNLYPTRSDVNQARGALAFGEVNGEQRQFGKECDFEVSQQQRLAEPAPAVRGDVARSMFYMAYQYRQYGLKLFSKQLRILQSWHQSDAPSTEERMRNEVIEKLQGNRNLFIDEPEKLDKLIAEGYFS